MASDTPASPRSPADFLHAAPSAGVAGNAIPAAAAPTVAPSVDAAQTTGEREAWRGSIMSIDDLAYKRRLLDDMENARDRGEAIAASGASAAFAPAAGGDDALARAAAALPRIVPSARSGGGARGEDDEIAVLRDRARTAESTCALLEEELARLESQTLEAMAEAGRLRKSLDDIERVGGKAEMGVWWRERVDLTRRLAEAERSRELLTSALIDSEAEIARLTRTLETAARKLNLAG